MYQILEEKGARSYKDPESCKDHEPGLWIELHPISTPFFLLDYYRYIMEHAQLFKCLCLC